MSPELFQQVRHLLRPFASKYHVYGQERYRSEARWWDKPARTTRRRYLGLYATQEEALTVARKFIEDGQRPPHAKKGRSAGRSVNYEARAYVNEHPSKGSGVWRAQIRKYDPEKGKVIRVYVAQTTTRARALELAEEALRTGQKPSRQQMGPRTGYKHQQFRKAPVFTKPRAKREPQPKNVVAPTVQPDRIAMMKMVLARLG